MKEFNNANFDCTQMIAFAKHGINVCHLVGFDVFEKNGFSLLFDKDIPDYKRKYFHSNDDEFFVEFIDKTFIGEFEDWVELTAPPVRIRIFLESIQLVIKLNHLRKVRILISKFAEAGVSSDITVSIDMNRITEKAFLMSNHNFDEWGDNIIINLND